MLVIYTNNLYCCEIKFVINKLNRLTIKWSYVVNNFITIITPINNRNNSN